NADLRGSERQIIGRDKKRISAESLLIPSALIRFLSVFDLLCSDPRRSVTIRVIHVLLLPLLLLSSFVFSGRRGNRVGGGVNRRGPPPPGPGRRGGNAGLCGGRSGCAFVPRSSSNRPSGYRHAPDPRPGVSPPGRKSRSLPRR